MIELAGAARAGLISAFIAGSATGICASLLVRLADRLGFADDGSDAPARKLQARPVAPIGGPAILLGCLVAAIVADRIGAGDWLAWVDLAGSDVVDRSCWLSPRAWIFLALLCAFGVGLWDDFKSSGLTPRQKLSGQVLAAALLALGSTAGGEGMQWDRMLLWFCGGIVAQNALNTFDNADGTAASMALLGFVAVAPAIAGALCGFLPFNLWLRRKTSPGEQSSSVPLAYLGDSGSHLLGMLLLLHPQARLALFVPLLDLARVAFVRVRAGVAPWIGDRRHLAHRLQRRGWTPTATAGLLCLLALPVIGTGLISEQRGGSWILVTVGGACSILMFTAVLVLCPERDSK